MNPFKPFFILLAAGLGLSVSHSFAQPPVYYLQYSYDANGNRTARELNYIVIRSGETADSLRELAAQAADMTAETTAGSPAVAGEPAPEAVSDVLGEQRIQLFPNPTTGALRVYITPFPQNTRVEVRLFDQQAHYLFTTPCVSETTLIDLSPYADGVYLMNVVVGAKLSGWKVVKE